MHEVIYIIVKIWQKCINLNIIDFSKLFITVHGNNYLKISAPIKFEFSLKHFYSKSLKKLQPGRVIQFFFLFFRIHRACFHDCLKKQHLEKILSSILALKLTFLRFAHIDKVKIDLLKLLMFFSFL